MGWDMGGKHKGVSQNTLFRWGDLKLAKNVLHRPCTMLMKPAPSCVHGAGGSRVGPVWEEVITGQGQPMGHSHHTTATAGEPEHRVVLPTPVTTCIRYTFSCIVCAVTLVMDMIISIPQSPAATHGAGACLWCGMRPAASHSLMSQMLAADTGINIRPEPRIQNLLEYLPTAVTL